MTTIWTGKNAKVKQDKRGGLRFVYRANRDMSFNFSLWCEVGERCKHLFAGFFETHTLDKEPLVTDDYPFVSDRLAVV